MEEQEPSKLEVQDEKQDVELEGSYLYEMKEEQALNKLEMQDEMQD